MHIAAPNDIHGVTFHLVGHNKGSNVHSDAASEVSGLSPIMNLDGMYVLYQFGCIRKPMSLEHMKHIIHCLNLVSQVHIIVPCLMRWDESTKTEAYTLYCKGGVICHLSFQLQCKG